MKRRLLHFTFLLCAVFFPATFLVAFQASTTTKQTNILYDGTLGGTPSTQGFEFLAFGSQAEQRFANGITTLDTMPSGSDLAGYFIGEKFSLDRALGYELQFTIQIQDEAHADRDRAGFSIIILSEDLSGIELGFWTNEIWAQEGGTDRLFKHAEGVAFNTISDLITYRLAISGDMYTLLANDSQILTGPLRDYTAFINTIDPYETPNFLFLGDNTTKAQAKSDIAYVALEAAVLAPDTPTPTATNTATVTATARLSATPTITPTPAPQPTRVNFWWRAYTSGYPSP